MNLPSEKPADCECAGWSYCSDWGEWPEGGHHPRCTKHHPEDCECIRCIHRRSMPKGVRLVVGFKAGDK